MAFMEILLHIHLNFCVSLLVELRIWKQEKRYIITRVHKEFSEIWKNILEFSMNTFPENRRAINN